MHQFDERTYTEVAAKLDMTPKAAKSLLYRPNRAGIQSGGVRTVVELSGPFPD